MDIIITKPERKKDYFMGRILTSTRKPIQVVLSDVQWMRTLETRDQNLLVRVFIPQHNESREALDALDAKVFHTCMQNNSKWFCNALDEDKFRSFFRPSVDQGHPSMGILCNLWAEPTVYVDGHLAESLKSLYVSKNARVKMLIEAQGVVFQKTLFGIRWMLRKCWIQTQDNTVDVAHPFEDERDNIESYWEEEVNEYVENISEHIRGLESLIHNARQMMSAAKATSNEVEWNELLKNISKTVFQSENALQKWQR